MVPGDEAYSSCSITQFSARFPNYQTLQVLLPGTGERLQHNVPQELDWTRFSYDLKLKMTLIIHVSISLTHPPTFCFMISSSRATYHLQHSDAAGAARRERTNQMFHPKYATSRQNCEHRFLLCFVFSFFFFFCEKTSDSTTRSLMSPWHQEVKNKTKKERCLMTVSEDGLLTRPSDLFNAHGQRFQNQIMSCFFQWKGEREAPVELSDHSDSDHVRIYAPNINKPLYRVCVFAYAW